MIQKELIFGNDCVRLALTNSRRKIYRLLMYRNSKVKQNDSDIALLAKSRQVPIQYTSKVELDNLLDNRPHQNVALEVSPFEPAVIGSPPEESANPQTIVFPVNVQDPQNLGSIIRSSYFYGASALVTCFRDTCNFTPIVSKASAGCMEVFEGLYRTKSAREFISNSKSRDFLIVGSSLCGSRTLDTLQSQIDSIKPKGLVVLVGNEGKGLSEDILNLCDFNLLIHSPSSIPDDLKSLNVGVATGIILDRLCNHVKFK